MCNGRSQLYGLILFLCAILPLHSEEPAYFEACNLREQQPVHLSIEHAKHWEEIAWGLMGRDALPENTGMLFSFPSAKERFFWMFNCRFSLSVAFMDHQRVIREIRPLLAYPEKMDPLRPVYSLEDMQLYPHNDPVRLFFQEQGIRSSIPILYALEVPMGWFKKQGVRVGDRLSWDDASPQAQIQPHIDISSLPLPSWIYCNKHWNPVLSHWSGDRKVLVTFYDEKGSAIKKRVLDGTVSSNPQKAPVAFCDGEIEKIKLDVF